MRCATLVLSLVVIMLVSGCGASQRDEEVSVERSALTENWESGPNGWVSITGQSPTLVSDPTSPSGASVQVLDQVNSSANIDYFSPFFSVVGGQTYCVRANVKWVSGAAPLLGIHQFAGDSDVGFGWVIGPQQLGSLGLASVVSSTYTGWQDRAKTIVMYGTTTRVRFGEDLYEGYSKGGSPLAYFDGIALDNGPCFSVPYLQDWESGVGAWTDSTGQPPTLATDATSPSGATVQVLDQVNASADIDYFSPFFPVVGGQTYCVRANVKWVSGAGPYLGVHQFAGTTDAGFDWVIGPYNTEPIGLTARVVSTYTGWQALSRTIVTSADTTQVRFGEDLYAGSSKGGTPLAYVDGIALESGPCFSVPYLEDWESGTDGWKDSTGQPPTLESDTTSPFGQMVQVLDQVNASADIDYFSPLFSVVGGQTYCVRANVKWVSGAAPLLGVHQFAGTNDAGFNWVIGPDYADTTGLAAVVSRTATGWQGRAKTIVMSANTTQVRFGEDLYEGYTKGGSPLAYFDGIALESGPCFSVPYLEDWQSGTDGWVSSTGEPPKLGSDTTSPSGATVQVLDQVNASADIDYLSPFFSVVGGQTYCARANVKWVSGAAPLLGVHQFAGANDAGFNWVIGPDYTDTTGLAAMVNSTYTGWQNRAKTIVMSANTTQVRFGEDLYQGSSKGGSPLAYFDGIALESGPCFSVPYLQNWESGVGAWTDSTGQPPTLTSDTTSPSGATVQVLDQVNASANIDYVSPFFSVVGGQTYCVRANVKWVSGAAPLLGVHQFAGANDAGFTWAIGPWQMAPTGLAAVVSNTDTGWQNRAKTVVMSANTTQVRFGEDLYEGYSKGGSALAYFDGIALGNGPCCSTGESVCNSICTSLATDPANCGACGNQCPIGNLCSAGQCVAQTPVPVAGGLFHTCALQAGGTVKCWGYNGYGQLGNGTTTSSSTPVAVSGLAEVTAVAAGSDYYTCALQAGGTVKCWGYNGYGELGNGTTTDSLTPVAVSGLAEVTAVAAGAGHTCALQAGGTVKCWGYNGYGQFGNGTTTSSLTPVAVSGLTGVTAVAAGNFHTCALQAGGTVKCWGYNYYGQLGNGTTSNSSTPVAVSGLSGANAVAAGSDHTCALQAGGTVKCWGNNNVGQLGNGTAISSLAPVAVSGLSGATAVAAGSGYTCALEAGGTVKCWGYNYAGQLGNGTTTNSLTPVPVIGLTPVALSTDKSLCFVGQDILVHWTGYQSTGDWIALAPVGSPAATVTASFTTGGLASGSHALSIPSEGMYEARFFDSASHLYATSAAFEVAALETAPDKVSYNSGDSILVSWNSSVDIEGQLVIAPVGSTLSTITASTDMDSASGSYAFDGISGGVYEVRILDSSGQLVTTGDSFIVIEPATVSVEKTSFFAGQNIVVHWTGCQSRGDTITLAYAGSAESEVIASVSTNGLGLGAHNFGSLAEGSYVARFFDDTSRLAATSSTFTVVAAPTLLTDKSKYLLGDPVLASWSGTIALEGQIVVAPVGSAVETITASTTASGALTGSHSFANLPYNGDYELRFIDTSSTWVATSVGFNVAPVVVSNDKARYTLGDSVIAAWRSVLTSGGRVVVAPVGSDWSTETAAIDISPGSGSYAFNGLPLGAYELRFFDTTLQLVASAPSFVVATLGATVSVDKVGYFVGQNIIVRWSGYESPGDWIAIAPVGSSDSEMWASFGTGGVETGELDVGQWWSEGAFEARFFDDTSRKVATSASFTVHADPSLLTDHSIYLVGDTVLASWNGGVALEGQIVVAPQGSSADTVTASVAVSGGLTGSYLFLNLPVGDYEIRFIDTASHWVTTSPGFRVAPVVVSNDKTGYGVGDSIVVTWRSTLPPEGQLVIAPAGSEPSVVVASTGISSLTGSYTFTGLPVGDYEVRVMDGTSQVVATTGSFSVYVRFSATQTSYAPNDFIVASWRDCPNDPQNRIVIAPDGSSDTTVTAQVFASSIDGAHAFGPLSAGTYRARYFSSGGSTKLFESDAIAITTPLSVSLVQVDLGDAHSCGVTSEHGVRCWGFNEHGQLGDGTTVDRNRAVQVGGVTNAVLVSAGVNYSCAALSDGKVRCWGYNGNGQLGDGSTNDARFSVEVAGINNALAVSAGAYHTCAVLSDAKVRCWGNNGNGQLGNGSTGDVLTAVEVSSISDAVAVSSGTNHTCALLSSGAVQCWGHNGYGELGNGSWNDASTPVEVAGISDAVALSVGGYHSCALLSGGAVRCWGANWSGQLGDGSWNDASTPVEIAGISAAVVVSAGSYHTCAMLSDGAARCWGNNANGQLGNGSTADPGAPTPVQAIGLAGVIGLGTGGYHSCALLSGGAVRCWGANWSGQLGDGTPPNSAELDGLAATRDLATGGYHSCVSSNDGQVRCWGANGSGQLGDGTTTSSTAPVAVAGISTAIDASAGESHSCSVLSNGHVRCWGSNASNQLGDGSYADSPTPVEVLGVTTATVVDAGYNHNCAILSDGNVKCWGYGDYGQLGNDLETALGVATAVSAGAYHSCAALDDGTVSCWGGNWYGQLGNASTTDSASPVEVSGITNATAVSAGGYHNCAILSDGGVSCWGANWYGQLGNGTTTDSAVPVEVAGITNAVAVAVGDVHSCARLADGRVMCWGYNGYAQLGDGTATDRLLPIEMGGVANAQSVATGAYHTCVLHGDGKLRCWGNNNEGEFGDGRHPYSLAPLTVMQR